MTARFLKPFLLALLCLLPAACVTNNTTRDMSAFRDGQIRSILVVPPVNHSQEVAAPDYYISTIAKPLAERGYYVFPINAVKRILEEDGLYDANMVHEADPRHLSELFGADAILYITVENWTAMYMVLDTTVKVEFSFVMKRGDTGETIWSNRALAMYSSSQGNQAQGLAGLVTLALSAAITRAAPNYMPYARQSTVRALYDTQNGLPPGPHLDEFKNPNKDPATAQPGT